MDFLPFDDFVPFAPDEKGASIRVNHASDDCSGNSKSLKIERENDGNISAYCFRCGKRGFHSDGIKSLEAIRDKYKNTGAQSTSTTKVNKLPRDATTLTSEWPKYAIDWIRKWGINNDEIQEHNISYTAYFDRIIFPVTWLSIPHGYASRGVNPSDHSPKWLLFGDGTPFYTKTAKGYEEEEERILVLVEDVVSAIRVAREKDCIALLTTTLSTNTLVSITDYDKFVIWLDNDNRQVKLNQLRLYKRLSTFAPTVVVHDTDPKRHSDEYIREKLCLI